MAALLVGMAIAFPAGASTVDAAVPPQVKGNSFLTGDDYPREALRARQEGAAEVALRIDPKGSILGCDVTRSSGFASLDEATCRVMRRLRFSPARDAQGHAVEGEFRRTMNWALPSR